MKKDAKTGKNMWKQVARRPRARASRPPARSEAAELVQTMADPKSWWVWLLGVPNPRNMGRRPKYFLGCLRSNLSQKEAAAAARKAWPQHVGHLEIQKVRGK